MGVCLCVVVAAADFRSFCSAIVLWEVLSGKKPFREFEDQYDDFAMQKYARHFLYH